MKRPRKTPFAERVWPRAGACTTGCWEWTAKRSRHGYGQLKYRGRWYGAHQAAWLLTHFTIPDGLQVLHHCDNPSCLNPAHLFLGTHADNMRDKVAKGRTANGSTGPSTSSRT